LSPGDEGVDLESVPCCLPCGVSLGAHPFFYNMEVRYLRLQEHPAVNPFIDPDGYRKSIDENAKDYLDKLTKEMNP
jgi:hypothetical protein